MFYYPFKSNGLESKMQLVAMQRENAHTHTCTRTRECSIKHIIYYIKTLPENIVRRGITYSTGGICCSISDSEFIGKLVSFHSQRPHCPLSLPLRVDCNIHRVVIILVKGRIGWPGGVSHHRHVTTEIRTPPLFGIGQTEKWNLFEFFRWYSFLRI